MKFGIILLLYDFFSEFFSLFFQHFFFIFSVLLLEEDLAGLGDHNGEKFSKDFTASSVWKFSSFFYTNGLYALEACIEVGEGCYHAMGTWWYDPVTLTLTPWPQGQKVKNACDPSKRRSECPECKNDHSKIVTLKYRSRSSRKGLKRLKMASNPNRIIPGVCIGVELDGMILWPWPWPHDLEMTIQGQKVKNACHPSKRSSECPKCKYDHFEVLTLKHRSRSCTFKIYGQ